MVGIKDSYESFGKRVISLINVVKKEKKDNGGMSVKTAKQVLELFNLGMKFFSDPSFSSDIKKAESGQNAASTRLRGHLSRWSDVCKMSREAFLVLRNKKNKKN